MVHNFRQVVVFSNSSSSKALFEIGLKSSTWAQASSQISDKRTLFVKWSILAVALRLWRWCELPKYKFEWRYDRRINVYCNFANKPANIFGTSTGCEPMVSTLALQCYIIELWRPSRPICWVYFNPWKEWDMKMMWAAEKQILNKDMIVAMKIRSSSKV